MFISTCSSLETEDLLVVIAVIFYLEKKQKLSHPITKMGSCLDAMYIKFIENRKQSLLRATTE